MKNKLTSIWTLGLLITIPIIIFLPNIFNKYQAELNYTKPLISRESNVYYKDINGNGKKERIISFLNTHGQFSFHYHNDDGLLQNQYNFKFKHNIRLNNLFFGDVNNNGTLEVYGFTLSNDSLYINWIEPGKNNNSTPDYRFITRIGTYNQGVFDFSVVYFEITDVNKDGINEILLSFQAGFSLHPRILVLFEPQNDILIKSEDIGINSTNIFLTDLDNDGRNEIVTSSASSGNLKNDDGSPKIDDRPYLQIFNDSLRLKMEPIPFSKGLMNNTYLFIENENNINSIVTFQYNASLPIKQRFHVFRFDMLSHKIDSVDYPNLGKDYGLNVLQDKNEYLVLSGDEIFSIDKQLKVKRIKEIPYLNGLYKKSSSSTKRIKYVGLNSSKNEWYAFADDFNHYAKSAYKDEPIQAVNFETNFGDNSFLIQTNQNEYIYTLQKNGLYYLKYPIYLIVYLMSVLFIWSIQNIREKQLNEKFELRNQLRNLELKSLHGQMDPHFMFNSFTTMASMLKKGNQEEAYSAFIKFTKLVRSNFDFSNQLTRPLHEELMVVKQFLELNKLRFKENLEYSITVSSEISQNNPVPKMMLQLHVENALKHGISKLKEVGKISVKIAQTENYMYFEIKDNGIGRKKAALLKQPSTKQGLIMLQAIYDRLNGKNKLKIKQQFVDLTDIEGNASGTLVKIRIPINLKE